MLDSAQEISNSSYPIRRYTSSEDIKRNTQYTFTVWGDLGEGKTSFTLFIGGDVSGNIKTKKIADGVYSGSGVFDDFASSNVRSLWVFPTGEGSPVCTIHKIKLEPGINSNPVWTPAPEDIVMRSELEDKLKGFRNVFFDKTNSGATYAIDNGLYLLFLSQGGIHNKYGMYFIRKTSFPEGCSINIIVSVNFEVTFSEDYNSIILNTSIVGDFNVSLFKVMDFT